MSLVGFDPDFKRPLPAFLQEQSSLLSIIMCFNWSTIDELGEGAWKDGATSTRAECKGQSWQPCEQQPPGTITLRKKTVEQQNLCHTHQKEGWRAGSKKLPRTVKGQEHTWNWIDLNSEAVKPHNPQQSLWSLHISATVKTTDQHCFLLDLT